MEVVMNKVNTAETGTVKSERVRLEDLSVSSEDKELISEYHLNISINGCLVSKVICTPSHLPELVVGRILTETGIKPDSIDSIRITEQQNTAEVTMVSEAALNPDLEIIPEHNISLPEIKAMAIAINERLSEDAKLHKATQSSHSCFLLKDGRIVFEAEDIGRHNAVDKAVGYIYMNDIDPMTTALFTTGRMPVDMVRKVIRASVPVFISKKQPTTDGVELAKEYGLTMIGNLRDDRLNIYNQ